jgi:hypothetical protein
MNNFDWFVCERSGRWAAALRVSLARQAMVTSREPRVYEVRSLEELAERLDTRPLSLALLEVHLSNLGKLFSWLADHSRRFPRSRFVAGLDYSIEMTLSGELRRMPSDAADVVCALLEAGAAEITNSPRRLDSILALAKKYYAASCESLPSSNESQSIVDWARSRLPWQLEHL